LKIPKVDLSKIDKKFLIAIPVIILFLILNVWMNSNSNKTKQADRQRRENQKENLANNQRTPEIELQRAMGPEGNALRDYHEQISGQENNQWNINRGGLIARSGEFYYYADSKLGILYKVALNGTKRLKMDHLPAVNNINIQDGWIYYSSRVFDGQGNKVSARVYKLNIQDQRKVQSNIHADIMILDDTYIYFTNLRDNRRVYRTDHNFENLQRITEEGNISNFFIEDGVIYYLTPQGILRMETDGTQKNMEVPAPNIQTFVINDGWIYYMVGPNNNLFTVPVGSPSDRMLLVRQAFDMHIYDNYIYYTTSNRGSFRVAKIGDISIELGTVPRSGINTMIGDVMFADDNSMAFGYSKKIYLQTNKPEPLAIDLRETRLGINREKIDDFVALHIHYDDRNTITRKILSDMGSFFEGNSIAYYRQFSDIDQNYLNEGFVIFRQYVSEDTGIVPGLLLHNGYQAGLLVFRWQGNRLNILGPYQIKQERRVAVGEFLTPDLKLLDITGNGKKEVVLELENNRNIGNLDIFAVYPVHVEPLDGKSYALRLKFLGYQ
jgi:hypothetical protein